MNDEPEDVASTVERALASGQRPEDIDMVVRARYAYKWGGGDALHLELADEVERLRGLRLPIHPTKPDPSAVDHARWGEILTAAALVKIVGGDEDYLPEDEYFPLGWQNTSLNDVSATAAHLVYLARLSGDFVGEMLTNYGSYFAAVRDIAETQWVGKQYVNPVDKRVIAIASRVMFFPNGATIVTSIATQSGYSGLGRAKGDREI